MAKCSPIDEKRHDAACLQNELNQLQYIYIYIYIYIHTHTHTHTHTRVGTLNSGNYLFTTDTKEIHVSKFYCPSM